MQDEAVEVEEDDRGVPDPPCNGASSSPKKGKMASARSAIIAACGQPSSSRFTKPVAGPPSAESASSTSLMVRRESRRTRLSCIRS